ncbi:hypothetical protein [Nioella sp.]|uniref:hypothetical protein n=1 Tax=Nioella sp. TaxID=1912091 RepID=UPI0035181188
MKLSHLFGAGAILALTACSGTVAPPLQGEVIMDKYGEPSDCVEGEYIPGAPYEQQCYPPQDDCPEGYYDTPNGCYPYREPEGGDDDSSDRYDPNGGGGQYITYNPDGNG